MNKYILIDKQPVLEPDWMKFAEWMETAERHIARETIGDAWISTVFLGLDHDHFGTGNPILFETMIFGGKHDGYQTRCATWDEAKKMHETAVEMVKVDDYWEKNGK